MTLFRRIRPAIAALLFSLLLVTPALGQPALWVVKQRTSTMYLFGTVHLLSSETSWRYAALEQALRESASLLVEQTDDDPEHLRALVLRYGLDSTHPLSGKLTRAENVRLAEVAQAPDGTNNLPVLLIMRPWLAALTLTMAPLRQAGFKASLGIDNSLSAQMSAAGKPVHALETAEQQFCTLASMPPAAELALLRAILDERKHDGAALTRLIAAWQSGDVAAIAQWQDQELRRRNGDLYRRLLTKRNQAWAKKLARQLQQPGTTFVAVGAGHLAGPDSLQVQLEKLGIEAVRQ